MVLIGLTVRATSVNALYSPMISQNVAEIKEHILSSQAVNDTGSILDASKTIIAYNKAKKANRLETGMPGRARVAQELVFKTTFENLIQFPFDSLLMVFNFNVWNDEFISNCLRDEIWGLESLRDLVAQEMIKAYLMRDIINGSILKEDYMYLVSEIDLLRKYGSDPNVLMEAENKDGKTITITSSKYFFGTDPSETDNLNYYSQSYFRSDKTGCPDGEFEQAFQDVANAAKSVGKMSFNPKNDIEWGSIKQMAQANARSRARQWIQGNQISLTLGGTEGGRMDSVVKNRGMDGFVGNFKTQWQAMKSLVGPVTPFFSRSFYKPTKGLLNTKAECALYDINDGVFRDCTKDQVEQYKECKKNEEEAEEKGIPCIRYRTIDEATTFVNKLNEQVRLEQKQEQTLNEVRSAFVYSITLDSVAEQTIYDIDNILFQMNGDIKRGYEGVNKKAGAGIPSLTNEISLLSKRQCGG